MGDNSYEAYKRDFVRHQTKRKNFYRGMGMLIIGVCFLIYLLYILPFHAGDASEICGDEMKAGGTYDRIQVYYIKELQLLCSKTDTDDGKIYSIAKFTDCDQNDWIICFTPGKDEQLAKIISDGIRISNSFDGRLDLTLSGYFQIQYMSVLPFEADSFYTIYGDRYANADGSNMLRLNADYLCRQNSNYMLELLIRPGIPLCSLVIGLVSVIYGGFLLVRNRSYKT